MSRLARTVSHAIQRRIRSGPLVCVTQHRVPIDVFQQRFDFRRGLRFFQSALVNFVDFPFFKQKPNLNLPHSLSARRQDAIQLEKAITQISVLRDVRQGRQCSQIAHAFRELLCVVVRSFDKY